MSVTRSNQGIKERRGNISNVSKTIDKQGLEGGVGYCANVLKNIGKTDFEGEGLDTCAQQWKTANIHKRKTSGMFHAENNQKGCGAPPPLGEDWIGLNPPILSKNEKVTGETTNVLRKGNWQKHHSR